MATEMLRQLHSTALPPLRTWHLEFDPRAPAATLAIEGSGLRAERDAEDRINIWADHPNATTKIAALDVGSAQLYGSAGSIVPCYVRHAAGGRLRASNVASNLLQRGERVRINTFATLQHLLGVPYPQDNLFVDLIQLEASGSYRATDRTIEYQTSLLAPVCAARYDDAMQVVHRQWRQLTSAGQPLCVLLSGGYDSRLNLALAQHYAATYGNEVLAFHEYKNEHEAQIAKRVAEVAAVPLTIKSRKEFVQRDRPVEANRDFVKLHSGTYRENLLRWHHYFTYIKQQRPHGTLVGFGAEAHKGKFYGHIQRFPEDCEEVFGIDESLVQQLARSIGIRRYDRNSQRRLFADFAQHAHVYSDHSSRVDFVHYQTYVANGYGKRGHSIWQLFGFAFPFLNDEFLRIVFSLPRQEKEGFRIVSRALGDLNASLLEVPFTSANEKALGEKKRSVFRQISAVGRSVVRPLIEPFRSVRSEGDRPLSAIEQKLIEGIQPGSAVTTTLHQMVRSGLVRTPRVHLDYTLQLLLFFHTLEKELSVSLEWE